VARRSSHRSVQSPLRRLARVFYHAAAYESREGRAAEVIAWSNGATGLGFGALVLWLTWSRGVTTSLGLALATTGVAFCALRLALANRYTVWIAAVLGTASIAALGGALAWVFAHLFESVAAFPSIAAFVGGFLAALAPGWSYAQLARQRADNVRDSLIHPISVPSSR